MQLLPARAHVNIERIGQSEVQDHSQAFRMALRQLTDGQLQTRIVACGHRVVHGGSRFMQPVLIDDLVVETVSELSRIAPLHNPGGLLGIEAARSELPEVPHVAVFDTAFHATLPAQSYLTGLPWRYYAEEGIRNYGFHGTNHDYVTRRAAELLGRRRQELRIVSLHLGNGASAAAVKFGKSWDTSMGFTPLAGLLMGTRTGDLDPGIILHLLADGLDQSELQELLNRQSGLKGLSGRSNDMRDLRAAAAAGDERSRHAIDVYTHRVRKAIGAGAAAMEGLDAIVFTAGVGENDSQLREDILMGMEWLGVQLSRERNLAGETVITRAGSPVTALVIPADEELMIALQTLEVLRTGEAQ